MDSRGNRRRAGSLKPGGVQARRIVKKGKARARVQSLVPPIKRRRTTQCVLGLELLMTWLLVVALVAAIGRVLRSLLPWVEAALLWLGLHHLWKNGSSS